MSRWRDHRLFLASSMEEASQIVQENKQSRLLSGMKQAEGEANKLKQQNKELVERRREQRKHSPRTFPTQSL